MSVFSVCQAGWQVQNRGALATREPLSQAITSSRAQDCGFS